MFSLLICLSFFLLIHLFSVISPFPFFLYFVVLDYFCVFVYLWMCTFGRGSIRMSLHSYLWHFFLLQLFFRFFMSYLLFLLLGFCYCFLSFFFFYVSRGFSFSSFLVMFLLRASKFLLLWEIVVSLIRSLYVTVCLNNFAHYLHQHRLQQQREIHVTTSSLGRQLQLL